MPRLSEEFKVAIKNLPPKELQKIVLKIARSNKEIYDNLCIEYLNGEEKTEELFEEARYNILFELEGCWSRIPARTITKGMAKAVKHLNQFAKTTKNKRMEADLLVELINKVLADYESELGTFYTGFDYKLAVLINRLRNLVTKKLHPDMYIEYEEKLTRYFEVLNENCRHIDYVFNMLEQDNKED